MFGGRLGGFLVVTRLVGPCRTRSPTRGPIMALARRRRYSARHSCRVRLASLASPLPARPNPAPFTGVPAVRRLPRRCRPAGHPDSENARKRACRFTCSRRTARSRRLTVIRRVAGRGAACAPAQTSTSDATDGVSRMKDTSRQGSGKCPAFRISIQAARMQGPGQGLGEVWRFFAVARVAIGSFEVGRDAQAPIGLRQPRPADCRPRASRTGQPRRSARCGPAAKQIGEHGGRQRRCGRGTIAC